ncbi:MFS transporter [Micromonospora sp. WMMD956]|nr:MFS transporter [Micromonospora sp. WMMD956]MDG4820066.1 MFS transporter [Micromonospora sp. WMMD956]
MAHRRCGLLRQHDFRSLWLGAAASQFGARMALVALPLVAVGPLHASAWQVGLVGTLGTVAFLVVGLPAGAVVDRVRQRRLLIGADLGRAALVASLAVPAAPGGVALGQLYVVVLGVGVLTVFFDVAHQSYLPRVVRPEELVEGNARLSTTLAVAQVAGPALAGLAVELAGTGPAVLLIAAGFAGSAAYLARIRAADPRPATAAGRSRLAGQIREGVAYVLRHPVLRVLALAGGAYNMFALVLQAMVPVRLVSELGASPAAASAYFSAGGAGGILGAVVARRLARRLGQHRSAWLCLLATAPFALLTPLIDSAGRIWLAAGGYLLLWAGATASNVAQVSLRQQLCPPDLLGRMNATMRFLLGGAMPLGALLGTVLGAAADARVALWVGAVGLLLSCLPLLRLRGGNVPGPPPAGVHSSSTRHT